jgi:hypothetical protein
MSLYSIRKFIYTEVSVEICYEMNNALLYWEILHLFEFGGLRSSGLDVMKPFKWISEELSDSIFRAELTTRLTRCQ